MLQQLVKNEKILKKENNILNNLKVLLKKQGDIDNNGYKRNNYI